MTKTLFVLNSGINPNHIWMSNFKFHISTLLETIKIPAKGISKDQFPESHEQWPNTSFVL